MYDKNGLIDYLQANNILALKIDHAVTGVANAISNQVTMTGAGAKRALYYASCFTDEYQDVCKNQKNEDFRFSLSVVRLLQHGDIAYEMLKIYFEEVFKHKTDKQLEYIKKLLFLVNIHIASSSLTNTGFALATASVVSAGLSISLEISALIGRRAGHLTGAMGIYGVVQKAAEYANRLKFMYPAYYTALYQQDLEMMYFLIAPVLENAGAMKAQMVSDATLADIIARMVG